MEAVKDFIFLGSKITVDCDCSHEIKRYLLLGRKAMTNLDSVLKNRDITLPSKICLVKAVVFPLVMYGCDSWAIKKAALWGVDAFALWCWRKLESPLNCTEIKPVSPEGNQSWIFSGKTDAEAPLFWPPNEKSQLIGKDPNAGKDWRQEKGMTEDEMVGWHHWLDGLEFEQALGVGEGQRSLACCSPWGRKELDTTEGLNNSNSIKVLRPRELGRLLFCDAGNSKILLHMRKYFWCFHHSSCILPSLGE